MRHVLLTLACILLATFAHAEPFEIKDGDRVLFLGDTLLEREGTYGYLEMRMAEQFPDRHFTVRNLAFSADTPLGWSRASFDPAAKGFERLKEQLTLVRPTVVFLGYGMAASLQEMTDRSQDWTLNRDTARYGAEPMSAARFKKELAQCMDAIAGSAGVPAGNIPAPGAAALPGKDGAARATQNAGGTPALHPGVRFVLLSPIRHEDLRKTRPGLPDPAEHNKLLEQYTKAIEELAKERGARFIDIFAYGPHEKVNNYLEAQGVVGGPEKLVTDSGIHLGEWGYVTLGRIVSDDIWPREFKGKGSGNTTNSMRTVLTPEQREAVKQAEAKTEALRAAIIRKNELFFHRWRPANETYLFGFRKREQGKNGAEIPMFDPLIEKAEAEIERLKHAPKGASLVPAGNAAPAFASRGEAEKRIVFAAKSQSVDIALSDGRAGYSDVLTDYSDVGDKSMPCGRQLQGCSRCEQASHLASTGLYSTITDLHPTSTGLWTRNTGSAIDACIAAIDGNIAANDANMPVDDAYIGVENEKKADFQPKTPVLTSSGQLYAANDAPATGSQPPVTNHQSPVTSPAPIPSSTLAKPDFTLADGLEITLWGENPLLAKPTEMNWDAQGRLWVASSAMYPMIAPGQVAFDKILVLEDPGHTGKATKSTVFADGLLIPTGVAPVLTPEGHWGCYVGQSTELLYFEDTDGDGKADRKRIVFSGFGTEDTHHIVHTLRWGPDGRLYFSQSVYIHTHMETPWGVVRVNSGGVFAYDPRTERVEVVEKGLWNTWGHAWDKWGQSFYTDGAGSSGLSWGFPGATFAPNEGARRTMASISPGSYPKFAGLELIYSPHFPADWQGSAVTCDFRAHKVVHFKINDLGEPQMTQISADGKKANAAASSSENLRPSAPSAVSSSPKSGYITEQLPVLVQTSDATFRPIDVKLGPDGALYIADWSNPIINHGEVDFRDPRRDHEHGRIWRLSVKGGAAVKWESPLNNEPKQLLEKTMSSSLWESAEAIQTFIQQLQSPTTSAAARAALDDALKQPAHLKILKAVRLNRTLPAPFPDFTPIGEMLIGNNANLATAAVPYFDPKKSVEAAKTIEQMKQAASGDTARRQKVEEIKSRITPLLEALKKDPSRENELRSQIQALSKEFGDALGTNDSKNYLLAHSKSWLAHNPAPRARVTAMRELARMPDIESASLILDAAVNAPKDDPYYEFAAWLSINDLAEVWTKAVLAGEWKPAGREKQFEFALNAIEPALAGQVLSQFVSSGRAPLDGTGPWIELIGNTGGPGELRPLLDGLLAATVADGKPLADVKHQFKAPDANRRAAAALTAAARRGVKPAGELPPATFYTHAPTDALPDVLRLAGLWKQNHPAAMFAALDTRASAPVLDAAFESLRTLATPEAADFLTAYFDPAVQPKLPPAALPALKSVIAKSDTNWRTHAFTALAALRPNEAMKHLARVLGEVGERGQQQLWRDLFASPPFLQRFSQAMPKDLPPAAYPAALRVAREMGRKGDGLAAKLSPLAGEKAADTAPADYVDLAARAKQNGDPVAGEAMYRRMASACTTCHAIGGAGGKLGPDMTSIGASAPLDYIVESILNPAAKVKEGYHAFSFTMKDGSEMIGIPSRETAQEQFIRTLAGEQGLPKANIVSKKIAEGGASLMPAGLTAAWTDRERLNLYAFLGELGRPGPFDASKNNVARAWQLTEVERDAPRTLRPPAAGETRDGATRSTDANATPTIFAYTLVDGRLTKDLLSEKIAMLAPKKDAVHLTARFQATTAGKAKLNLTGIRKAWLDGQPLAVASEPSPSVDLTAGAHTFTIEVDAKTLPDVLRVESPAVSFLGD